MDDINTQPTASQKCVADIWDRLAQHDQEHGGSQRNDQHLWQLLDSVDQEAFAILRELAKDHAHYDESDFDDWYATLATREPFLIRLKSERYKSNGSNTLIWKLLMMAKEIIRARLKRVDKQ